jgi:hypothetical protein
MTKNLTQIMFYANLYCSLLSLEVSSLADFGETHPLFGNNLEKRVIGHRLKERGHSTETKKEFYLNH